MKKRYDKISTYFKENWYIVIPLCITALLFNGLMCFIPTLEGKTINSLLENDFDLTLHLVIYLISLVLFVQFNRFCKRYLVRVFGNKMSLKMRKISLSNLLHKNINYFSLNTPGDILNKNIADIYDTTEGIRKMTTEIFDTIVLLLGYLISLFMMDYQVTLYVSIFIILSILCAELIKHFVYKVNKDYKEYLSINKQITLIKLNNELYYRGFGVRENYFEDYAKSVHVLKKKNIKALIFKSSLEPLYSIISYMGVFFIIYILGKKVMHGEILIGTFYAYLTTFLLMGKKATKVGKVFNAYQGFKVSWVRCKEYLISNEETIIEEKIAVNKLVLKDFYYGYHDGFCLPKINIEINKGQIIGVCGKVHVGKTTFLKALTGLYNYAGEAYVDNVELTKIVNNKHQYISYCASEVALFNDTLKNNITLSRKGSLLKSMSIAKIDNALEHFGAIETLLTHTNSNLSGGQQKRVQMARAVYSDANIILLDDPFQSVNLEMALEMVDLLKKEKDKIIILVTNNKAILNQMDKIIYLEEKAVCIDSYQNLLLNQNFKCLMEA